MVTEGTCFKREDPKPQIHRSIARREYRWEIDQDASLIPSY